MRNRDYSHPSRQLELRRGPCGERTAATGRFERFCPFLNSLPRARVRQRRAKNRIQWHPTPDSSRILGLTLLPPPACSALHSTRRMPAGANSDEVATAFTSLLDQHVEIVNSFYMDRIEEGVIILHALQQHAEQVQAGTAKPELRAACQRSLVSFHFQLLVLQNYVALNFTALTKILKKFEKKFDICIKDEYINAIVALPFYRCDSLGDLVEETERQFKQLESLRQPPPQQPGAPGGGQPHAAHAAHGQPNSGPESQQLMPPPPQRPKPGVGPTTTQQQFEASHGKAPIPAQASGMALS